MSRCRVIFSHGRDSGPWGSKITRLARTLQALDHEVDSIDYRGLSEPRSRVDRLLAYLRSSPVPYGLPTILAGSSMGGWVSAAASVEWAPAGLFLVAPAFHMPGYEALGNEVGDCKLTLVHGWDDDVVPVENVIRFAREQHATLHLLDGNHRLHANLDHIERLLLDFLVQVATAGE